MDVAQIKKEIVTGKTTLGIEFGSTRIKAVLIASDYSPIESGSFEWENQLVDGFWTYSLDSIWQGLQSCYQALRINLKETYEESLEKIASIGFSGMMHGYLAFNKKDELLVPFRTWRNSNTAQAEQELTALFNFNIPLRWSIAHLYQGILEQEAHVKEVAYMTTLAGYIHWQLTGRKVLGVGDASGMFPINSEGNEFNQEMVTAFDQLIAQKEYPWQLAEILPEVLVAGAEAGQLTAAGAKRLDISGNLQEGIPLCPPEGDAGTGMVATNAVAKRTGNVSAGTSVFAMIVLEKNLQQVYPEIDLVTTPSGSSVAMVHANNCSSDINAWVKLFGEFATASGHPIETNHLYQTLFNQALEGDEECGGLLSYGYYSGENITGLAEGRPLFVRTPESNFNLANFMRVHLFSAFGALKIGMDILLKEEQVEIDRILGHGGIFTTKEVGQRVLAGVIDSPVSVMETAGEGGAWGIALLAAYLKEGDQLSLADFLEQKVFAGNQGSTVSPRQREVRGFETFMTRYQKGLPIEQGAVDYLT
ncbi:FGGY-family carbohydrate kinase [uncultured Vagococcus sp.]|uniref:xylulokinase n=1 Tax=uncultured Vagococcus sp. TaxID=189676 RepID=UPI0028D87FDE|nr:FGGY-family carbohydrate kinase [uncultured Vagococcus sp.]